MNDNTTDLTFARCYDMFEGNFSEKLAGDILIYGESNKRKIKSALDICCGTGRLMRQLINRGIKCHGTETENAFIEQTGLGASDIKIVTQPFDIPFKDSFDLITCTHDVVNTFGSFEEWKTLFKNVCKHLDGNGMFVFDYYTKTKLSNWNELKFKSDENADMVFKAQQEKFDRCSLDYTFYLNDGEYMLKTKQKIFESYYDDEMIINELKKSGFKKVMLFTKNLDPIESINAEEKVCIIATKK